MQMRFAFTNFHRFTLDTRSAGGEPPSRESRLLQVDTRVTVRLGVATVTVSDRDEPPGARGGPAVPMMAHTPAGSSESGEPESESPAAGAAAHHWQHNARNGR